MTSKPVTPLPPNRQRGNGTTRSPLAAGEQRGTEGSGCFPHALPDAGTDGSAFPPARLPREANGPNGSAPEHGTPVRPAAALRERPRRGRSGGGGPGPPPAAAGPLPAPRAAPASPRRRTAAPPRPGPAAASHPPAPPRGPDRFPRGRRAAPQSGSPGSRQRHVTTRRNSPTTGRGSELQLPVLREAALRGSRPARLGLPPTTARVRTAPERSADRARPALLRRREIRGRGRGASALPPPSSPAARSGAVALRDVTGPPRGGPFNGRARR